MKQKLLQVEMVTSQTDEDLKHVLYHTFPITEHSTEKTIVTYDSKLDRYTYHSREKDIDTVIPHKGSYYSTMFMFRVIDGNLSMIEISKEVQSMVEEMNEKLVEFHRGLLDESYKISLREPKFL